MSAFLLRRRREVFGPLPVSSDAAVTPFSVASSALGVASAAFDSTEALRRRGLRVGRGDV
ncbi:MAG TPA: hypothetical protein VFX61_18470 [Micromonosporaceae bacterium]|nr:hypothetical protein [Micromonosporaceae bacterium]